MQPRISPRDARLARLGMQQDLDLKQAAADQQQQQAAFGQMVRLQGMDERQQRLPGELAGQEAATAATRGANTRAEALSPLMQTQLQQQNEQSAAMAPYMPEAARLANEGAQVRLDQAPQDALQKQLINARMAALMGGEVEGQAVANQNAGVQGRLLGQQADAHLPAIEAAGRQQEIGNKAVLLPGQLAGVTAQNRLLTNEADANVPGAQVAGLEDEKGFKRLVALASMYHNSGQPAPPWLEEAFVAQGGAPVIAAAKHGKERVAAGRKMQDQFLLQHLIEDPSPPTRSAGQPWNLSDEQIQAMWEHNPNKKSQRQGTVMPGFYGMSNPFTIDYQAIPPALRP